MLIFHYMPCSTGISLTTWSDGSNEEIANMINAADNNELNLSDYWSIGQERIVRLDAINTGYTSSDTVKAGLLSQPAQDVILVLMDNSYNNNNINFVVGQKNCLTEIGYIGSSNTISFHYWNGCGLDHTINRYYFSALPVQLRTKIKLIKVPCLSNYNNYSQTDVDERITLFSLNEVGGPGYSMTAEGSLVQYYKTASNRIKKRGMSNVDTTWLTRSVKSSDSPYYFCSISADATYSFSTASNYGDYVSPFFCI